MRPVSVLPGQCPGGEDSAVGESEVRRQDFQESRSTKTEEEFPGYYGFGVYFLPGSFSQFGIDAKAHHLYGFYWHADRMIFRGRPGSDEGLTLWTAILLSPQPNIQWVINPGGTGNIPNAHVPGTQVSVTF